MKHWLRCLWVVGGATLSLAACLGQQRSGDLVKPSAILDVGSLAFAPDGRTLAAGANDGKKGGVALWDTKTLKIRRGRQLDQRVAALAFSPDSKTLAVATFSEHCYLLDAESGNVRTLLSGHGKATRDVAFAPDGKVLAIAASGGDVHLWDWRAGQRMRTLKGHPGEIYHVAYSPDGKLLACSGNSTSLWEPALGKQLRAWEMSYPIAFDPRGQWLATGSNDSSLTLRDLKDYNKARAFYDGIYPYFCLAIHPSGKSFAVCSGLDKEVRAFRLDLSQAAAADEKRIGALLALWQDDRIEVRDKASKDVVKCGDMAKPLLRKAMNESPSAEVRVRAREALRVLASPKPMARLTGHHEVALRCVFSPDGQTLATSARDGLVLLWDTSTYQLKATFTWPK